MAETLTKPNTKSPGAESDREKSMGRSSAAQENLHGLEKVFIPYEGFLGTSASKEQLRRSLAQPVQTALEDPAAEASFLDALLGTSMLEPPIERHAEIMSDPRFSHPANAPTSSRIVNRLHQTYGNDHVQRVTDYIQAMQDEGLSGEEVSADIEQTIARRRGAGKPVERGTRSQMESLFGHDFSDVSIHTDSTADSLAKALQAKAFTVGSDVFFREGTYQPGSESGRKLLGHELTHVAQHPEGKPQPKALYDQASPNHIMREKEKTFTKEDLKLILRDIISQEWMNQSNCKSPIKLTRTLIRVIKMVTPLTDNDLKLLWLKPPKTPTKVLQNIDHSLRATIPASMMGKLHKLRHTMMLTGKPPGQVSGEGAAAPESKESDVLADIKGDEDIAKTIVDALQRKEPEEDKEVYTEAVKKALEAYLETEPGKKLKARALELLLEGLPVVLMTGGTALAGMIAEDTDIPSTPDIPLSDNLTLKVEFEGTFHKPVSVKLSLKFTFGGPEKREKREQKPEALQLPPDLQAHISRIDPKNKMLQTWIVHRAFYEYDQAGPDEEEHKRKIYYYVKKNPDEIPRVQLIAKALSQKLIEKGIQNKINQLKGKKLQKSISFHLEGLRVGPYDLSAEFWELKGLETRLAWLLNLLVPKVPYQALGIEQVTFVCGVRKRYIPVKLGAARESPSKLPRRESSTMVQRKTPDSYLQEQPEAANTPTSSRIVNRLHQTYSNAHVQRVVDDARSKTDGRPGSESGRKLLRHELTHVVQQSRGSQLHLSREKQVALAKGGKASVSGASGTYAKYFRGRVRGKGYQYGGGLSRSYCIKTLERKIDVARKKNNPKLATAIEAFKGLMPLEGWSSAINTWDGMTLTWGAGFAAGGWLNALFGKLHPNVTGFLSSNSPKDPKGQRYFLGNKVHVHPSIRKNKEALGLLQYAAQNNQYREYVLEAQLSVFLEKHFGFSVPKGRGKSITGAEKTEKKIPQVDATALVLGSHLKHWLPGLSKFPSDVNTALKVAVDAGMVEKDPSILGAAIFKVFMDRVFEVWGYKAKNGRYRLTRKREERYAWIRAIWRNKKEIYGKEFQATAQVTTIIPCLTSGTNWLKPTKKMADIPQGHLVLRYKKRYYDFGKPL